MLFICPRLLRPSVHRSVMSAWPRKISMTSLIRPTNLLLSVRRQHKNLRFVDARNRAVALRSASIPQSLVWVSRSSDQGCWCWTSNISLEGCGKVCPNNQVAIRQGNSPMCMQLMTCSCLDQKNSPPISNKSILEAVSHYIVGYMKVADLSN
jgi:hypothetical protein